MRKIALVLSLVVLSQLTACVAHRHYSDTQTRSYNSSNSQYQTPYPNQFQDQSAYRPSQEPYRADYQTSDPQSRANWAQIIDVRQIREVTRSHGGGAVIGAIIGGIIGNQLGQHEGHRSSRRYGRSHGRDYYNDAGRGAATLGGAIVGGAIGNEIDHGSSEQRIRTEITLRFTNGQTQTLPLDHRTDVRIGDWIQVGFQGGRWVIF